MKLLIPILTLTLLLLSGCTQVVTAPLSIASSAVGATVDVADAVTPDIYD